MTKAIEKAWKENLKEDKEDQWKSKEDLIENSCPHNEYKLKIKGFKDDDELCKEHNEDCTKCWNCEIEEEVEEVIESNEGNFKIKILETDEDNWVTKGKIYEFKDGRMMWNNGQRSSYYPNFESFLHNCNWIKAREIEVVEQKSEYKILEDRIKEYQNSISYKQSKIEDLKDEKEELKERLNSMQNIFNKKQNQWENEQVEEIDKFKNEIKYLKIENVDLLLQLADYKGKNKVLEIIKKAIEMI